METLDQKQARQKEKGVKKSQRFRQKLYKDSNRHDSFKKQDAERKRKHRESARQNMSNAEKSDVREKERLRKKLYRLQKKGERDAKKDPKTPQEMKAESKAENRRKTIAAVNRTRRRYEQEIEHLKIKLIESKSAKKSNQPPCTPPRESLKVSSLLWKSLTPNARRKSKMNLKESLGELPSGTNSQFRDIGINLSNPCNSERTEKYSLEEIIVEFLNRDDVSRISPDIKKVVTDPNNSNEKIQVRYLLGYRKTLYYKFLSESTVECSYETFTRHIPCYIKKANPGDWGTCLCETCLNPELKIEKLFNLKLLKRVNLEECINDDYAFQDLITNLENLQKNEKSKSNVQIVEWNKIPFVNKKGKKSYRSRKENKTFTLKSLVSKLVRELKILKEHLHRAHMQFREFKQKRTDAINNENVATFQVDWSENPKVRQAIEEKSAYYHQDQYSVHPVRVWTKNGEFSHAALSDVTDHKAGAVFASLKPIFQCYINVGVNHLNIISDSPTSQYRNKKIFWLMQQFCNDNQVTMEWIYLESGKGKGVPDGIGATVKRAIHDAISNNPDKSFNTLEDFMDILPVMLPSISLTTYDQNDVDQVNISIPQLQPVSGTMKCHHILAMYDKGQTKMSMREISSMSSKPFNLKQSLKITSKKPATKVDSDLDDTEDDHGGSEDDDNDNDISKNDNDDDHNEGIEGW